MSPPIALRLAALALLVVLARAQTSSARVDVATRAAGRPANAANPAVQAVERVREWPTTVDEYARMMDQDAALPVRFTQKGDRDVVCFLFYRVRPHRPSNPRNRHARR